MRNCSILTRCWTPLVAAALLWASVSRANSDCSLQNLERFVERARQADKNAIAIGQLLVRCPLNSGVAERAVQWLAFLYHMSGNSTQAQRTDIPLANQGRLRGGENSVLMRARAGNYAELVRLVDNMTPGYTTNALAQLVLARVAVRKGAFERGREAYRTYLRINPRDEDAVCEELFSWIWQGAYTEAEQEFRDARRYGGSARLTKCIDQGLSLIIAKIGAKQPLATNSNISPERWRLAASLHQVPRLWRRQSLQTGYHGPVSVQIAGHELRLLALGKGVTRATEIRIGKSMLWSSRFYWSGEIGFWSPGRRNGIGATQMTARLAQDWGLTAAAERQPLALVLPMVPEARGVLQDTVSLGASFAEYAALKLSLSKDDKYSPFEKHTLLLRWPAFKNGPRDFVRLRLPLALERHPRANPNYIADVQTRSFGLGFELNRSLPRQTELAVEADYSLEFATARDPSATQSRYGTLDARLQLITRPISDCSLLLEAAYHRADEEDVGQRRLLANSLSIGGRCGQ